MRKLIVVNNPRKWKFDIQGVDVVSTKDYLENPNYGKNRNIRVFNLCNDYAYQTRGYYVSLLAEARGHKVIPSVKHLMDLKMHPSLKVVVEDLDELIQKGLKRLKSDEFVLSIYLGQSVAVQYNKLAKEFHKMFQVPFLKVKFEKNHKWRVVSVKALALKDIPETHLPYVADFAKDYFSRTRYANVRDEKYKYDLAILVDPKEKNPPSSAKAISRFEEVAERMGCYVDLITKDDFARIREFDMLLIRTTTSVNHYTYYFARRAQKGGLVVIDSPESILKCANKVYLAEMLQAAKIPTPKSIIVGSMDDKNIEKSIGFPCVLKLPDSSFSLGVKKVQNAGELKVKLAEMLKRSELVLVQEFLPTDYDWRVGVLGGEVLFVCRYYMAKDHWQIYNWDSNVEDDITGNFDNVPLGEVPELVIQTALKATRQIGDGLYGVDVKYVDGKAVIIEVNDNPNIDFGVEDLLLKDALYEKIIGHMIAQVEKNHTAQVNLV